MTDKKISRVLVCSSISFLFEKMDQRNCIQFCVKNEIKCAKTFKMLTVAFGESTMSRTQVNCDIAGLRNAEKMSMSSW